MEERNLKQVDISADRKDAPKQTGEYSDILYKFSMLSEHDKKIVSEIIDALFPGKEDEI